MNRTILFFILCCLNVSPLFAQEEANKLRDEGDAALKAKNYAVALTKYSEYLKQTNYEDGTRLFNAGICATQTDDHNAAIGFFDKCIQKGVSKESAYLGKAMALRDLNKADEFSATLEAGLKEFPGNANMEKLVYGYFMKEGQADQKAGKTDEAAKMFQKVTSVSDKTYKSNALYSLGILYFNDGAKMLKDATPLATSDPDKYTAAKDKATASFQKAKGYLEQAIEVTPDNEKAKKSLQSLIDVLK